jgi:hypothetical protein
MLAHFLEEQKTLGDCNVIISSRWKRSPHVTELRAFDFQQGFWEDNDHRDSYEREDSSYHG